MIVQEEEKIKRKKKKKEHYSNAMIIVDCTLFGGNVQSSELRPQKHETRNYKATQKHFIAKENIDRVQSFYGASLNLKP